MSSSAAVRPGGASAAHDADTVALIVERLGAGSLLDVVPPSVRPHKNSDSWSPAFVSKLKELVEYVDPNLAYTQYRFEEVVAERRFGKKSGRGSSKTLTIADLDTIINRYDPTVPLPGPSIRFGLGFNIAALQPEELDPDDLDVIGAAPQPEELDPDDLDVIGASKQNKKKGKKGKRARKVKEPTPEASSDSNQPPNRITALLAEINPRKRARPVIEEDDEPSADDDAHKNRRPRSNAGNAAVPNLAGASEENGADIAAEPQLGNQQPDEQPDEQPDVEFEDMWQNNNLDLDLEELPVHELAEREDWIGLLRIHIQWRREREARLNLEYRLELALIDARVEERDPIRPFDFRMSD